MKFVYAVAGTALFACNLAGLAETKIPCDQSLIAPLRSSAVLVINARPAGLDIVGMDQEAIHDTCHGGGNEEAPRHILLEFSPNSEGGTLTIEGNHMRHGDNLQIASRCHGKRTLAYVCLPEK